MAIQSFRHKGLRWLFQDDDARGVRADQSKRLRRLLAQIDTAHTLDDLRRFPGDRMHELKGKLKGRWSLTVSGNWRLTFRFEEGDAFDLDLVDYH
jgi:proteic killer suppression protein